MIEVATWASVESLILDETGSVFNTVKEDIEVLSTLGVRVEYSDGRPFLHFDDPNKEMIFRLKYS